MRALVYHGLKYVSVDEVADATIERPTDSETDEQGRTRTSGKAAFAAIVGNEVGAHHIAGILFQTLNDVGFTIPAGSTYWNGEAMHSDDYQDLDSTPDAVAPTTTKLAANTAHLARLLRHEQYSPVT